MLIVNADDYGARTSATNAICDAFDAGAITSTSAMVWMGDSARAASRASEHGLPVGLHLNLTLPFAARNVPSGVRERQRRLTEVFNRDGWWEDPARRVDRELLRGAIGDQLERFCEQFGQPTHIDGHHHVHLHEAVLELLPQAWPIRTVVRDPAQADSGLSQRERRLRRRFRAPDMALPFEKVHPDFGGVGLNVLDRAHDVCVEVMTHPQQQVELDALMGSEWRATLAALPLGSYLDLENGRKA
jgi:chitin disaccharide deacetylase